MRIGIGIIAPSSKVPNMEFSLGTERLRQAGFSLYIHQQCYQSYRFFAGTDPERAKAFFEFAIDPRFSVLWCARGGYGAIRILPLLDQLSLDRGIPEKKLLVGFSDATVLLEFVRTRWGWSTLHAEMPGVRKFCTLSQKKWDSLVRCVHGDSFQVPLRPRLRFVGKAPRHAIQGKLVGGNLRVWSSLLGTPFSPMINERILFFEDVDESLYRIDAMVQQVKLSGGFHGIQAIILGEFFNCKDRVSQVLSKKPIRKQLNEKRLIPLIFAEAVNHHQIPVAYGLPIGHGSENSPLPIGANYRLEKNGQLKLIQWDWLKK